MRTDRHDEANSRLSQFLRTRLKLVECVAYETVQSGREVITCGRNAPESSYSVFVAYEAVQSGREVITCVGNGPKSS